MLMQHFAFAPLCGGHAAALWYLFTTLLGAGIQPACRRFRRARHSCARVKYELLCAVIILKICFDNM